MKGVALMRWAWQAGPLPPQEVMVLGVDGVRRETATVQDSKIQRFLFVTYTYRICSKMFV